jgi:dihydrofolate reductase
MRQPTTPDALFPVSAVDGKLTDMSTQYYTASSIDGFIADPDNSLDWLFQFSEASGIEDQFPKFMEQVGAMAMGSTTYEWVANHTGFLTDAAKWEYTVPTWVFSSRELPRVDGPDIRFVSGDVRPIYNEMVQAAEGKNVWLVGGGDLVGQFHDQGLLDEVIISIASVFLGSGAPLLPRRIVTPPLQLLEATAYGADFAMLRYAVRKDSAARPSAN